MNVVSESSLRIFSFEARVIYQIINWPIVIVGVIGNLGVLWRAGFERKLNSSLKPLYRGALLSLAASDLLLLATSGSNLLANLTRPIMLWSIPDWMCPVIPYIQSTAVLTTSLTLAGIAMDRYRAMKPKYPPPSGPRWPMAACFVLVIWCLSAAASYPVLDLYSAKSLIVATNTTYYRAALCVTINRTKAATVYSVLFAVIFVPLGIAFLTVHALLALKIWRRRIRGERSQLAASGDSQFTETSTASTSSGRPPNSVRRPMPTTSPHAHRKIRTVRVILALILVFCICRLPLWVFLLVKLYVVLSGKFWWHLQTCLSSLSLLNAAVHPFLYVFLNEALSFVSWIRSWCGKTEEANLQTAVPREKLKSSVSSIKVPRGPYAP